METQKSMKQGDGAPGRIRTSDHLVRSQVLYPTELRARCLFGTAAEVAYIRDSRCQSQQGKHAFFIFAPIFGYYSKSSLIVGSLVVTSKYGLSGYGWGRSAADSEDVAAAILR